MVEKMISGALMKVVWHLKKEKYFINSEWQFSNVTVWEKKQWWLAEHSKGGTWTNPSNGTQLRWLSRGPISRESTKRIHVKK